MIVSVAAIVIKFRTCIGEHIYKYGILISFCKPVKRQVLYMVIHIVHVWGSVQFAVQPFPNTFVIFGSIKLYHHHIRIHGLTGHSGIWRHTHSQFYIALEIKQVCTYSRVITASDACPVRTAKACRNHGNAVNHRQPFAVLTLQIKTKCPVIDTADYIGNPLFVIQSFKRCLKCIRLGKVKMTG